MVNTYPFSSPQNVADARNQSPASPLTGVATARARGAADHHAKATLSGSPARELIGGEPHVGQEAERHGWSMAAIGLGRRTDVQPRQAIVAIISEVIEMLRSDLLFVREAATVRIVKARGPRRARHAGVSDAGRSQRGSDQEKTYASPNVRAKSAWSCLVELPSGEQQRATR